MKFSRRLRSLSALVVLSLLLGGCTWVHIRPEAESLRFVRQSATTSCKKIGEVSANVVSHIWFLKRSHTKVRNELAILARNEAVSLGGNTVAPIGEIVLGGQQFGVYDCP
jgi:hypothetical protein